MKRLLILALLLTGAARAATQILDTAYTGISGTLFTGRMTISAPDMTTQDGRTVLRWQQDFTVTNGVVNVTLEPNDTATPAGTSYVVRFTPNRGPAWTERWIVPTSATALKVNQVRVLIDPTPDLMIQPAQILSGGAGPGQCMVWSGSSWQPGSCAGQASVTSVFGRTGDVVAQQGDYSFAQISGAAANAQIAAGVDAAKIGTGAVDNTEFAALDGVTSAIQTQLDGKAAVGHSHTTGGDLSGDIASATVARIQGRAVAATAPDDAQALVWSAANNRWEPGTVSGGGGGGASYFDHTVYHAADDFCGTSDVGGALGVLRWGTAGFGGGSPTAAPGAGDDANHICVVRVGTPGSSVGQGTAFYQYVQGHIKNVSANYTWQVEWIYMLEVTTSIRVAAGLGNQLNANPSYFLGAVYDSSMGSALQYAVCVAGSCTYTDSGFAPAGYTYFRVRMRGTGPGQWAFCVNACSSETTMSVGALSVDLTPLFAVQTLAAAAKYAQLDRYEIRRTGLTRY